MNRNERFKQYINDLYPLVHIPDDISPEEYYKKWESFQYIYPTNSNFTLIENVIYYTKKWIADDLL